MGHCHSVSVGRTSLPSPTPGQHVGQTCTEHKGIVLSSDPLHEWNSLKCHHYVGPFNEAEMEELKEKCFTSLSFIAGRKSLGEPSVYKNW